MQRHEAHGQVGEGATDLADKHGEHACGCHLADNPVAVSAFARHGFKEFSPCAVDLDKIAHQGDAGRREKWGTSLSTVWSDSLKQVRRSG